MKKPGDILEYKNWVKHHLNIDFDNESSRNLYTTNLNTAQMAVAEHEFFRNLDHNLESWAKSYETKTGSLLLMGEAALNLKQKTYDSAVDKSFRVNVLLNERFPNAPKNGWITPANLYSDFNDELRGTLVCRFIDGPKYVATKLRGYAKSLELKGIYYSQEREDGYYAYHFYVFVPVKFLDESFKAFDAHIPVEIQITTQLQDVLRSLAHRFYEMNRLKLSKATSKWKWDYGSNRFKVGYLSHTLHLLESIILESRNLSLKESRKLKK